MAKYIIVKDYLKRVSFTCDTTPGIFLGIEDSQSNLGLDINIGVAKSNNDVYDVTLNIGLSPRMSDNTEVFHFEISYAALVVFSNPESADEEEIHQTLMIDVPMSLISVVRFVTNQQIVAAGFPHIQFPQIDFEELYRSKIENVIPSLSYESVVSEMLCCKDADDFVQICKSQGMEPTLEFVETPMSKYLMRYIDVPDYNTPEINYHNIDYSFYQQLYRMLMMADTVKIRFSVEDGALEVYVTNNEFQDVAISRMNYYELKSLMEGVIVNSWVNYNVTLGKLFGGDMMDEADSYLAELDNNKMISFKEYSTLFMNYSDKTILDMRTIKEWYNKLQRIDIETIPYRF